MTTYIERYDCNVEACIKQFIDKQNIAAGPVFVCTCCHQTWFKHSVTKVNTVLLTVDQIQKYCTKFISVNNCEWICNTCLLALKKGNTPSCAVANYNAFPIRPKELELHQLEERLISLRIPFMQIRELPRGGQLAIKGNVVSVPVDIQPVVQSLFESCLTVTTQYL